MKKTTSRLQSCFTFIGLRIVSYVALLLVFWLVMWLSFPGAAGEYHWIYSWIRGGSLGAAKSVLFRYSLVTFGCALVGALFIRRIFWAEIGIVIGLYVLWRWGKLITWHHAEEHIRHWGACWSLVLPFASIGGAYIGSWAREHWRKLCRI